jgi:hypothetical protein
LRLWLNNKRPISSQYSRLLQNGQRKLPISIK